MTAEIAEKSTARSGRIRPHEFGIPFVGAAYRAPRVGRAALQHGDIVVAVAPPPEKPAYLLPKPPQKGIVNPTYCEFKEAYVRATEISPRRDAELLASTAMTTSVEAPALQPEAQALQPAAWPTNWDIAPAQKSFLGIK